MTAQPKILVFSGSSRKDSLNKKLAKAAFAMMKGVDAKFIDLKDYDMPLYDGDLEAQGTPEGVRRLRDEFVNADALFIASPEYNSSLAPLLKNALDWVSRADGDVPGMVAYKNKVAGIVSASPGMLGGLRSLRHLREVLQASGVLVTVSQHAVGAAHEAFDADGNLVGERHIKAVQGVVDETVKLVRMTKF